MAMDPKSCMQCNVSFVPKERGHNARYCSKACKSSFKYANRSTRLTLEEKRAARRKSYLQTKKYPERYEKHLSSNRGSVKNVRTWLASYKTENGCIDCGYNHHSAALQMDHLGTKRASISDLRSSIARLEKEIESGNCVVRCAVCHSVKTWADKNGLKYVPSMAYPKGEENNVRMASETIKQD